MSTLQAVRTDSLQRGIHTLVDLGHNFWHNKQSTSPGGPGVRPSVA
ncbi:MAG: hypothetical protein ABIN90_08760 [Knoellia sp.]